MKSFFRPIWTIAANSYKEIIRDRLLYGILIMAMLVTAASFFFATISFEQNGRVLQNIGLASIHIFTAFIVIFVTSNSLHKDFERRALYLLFPKPISKTQYVLGKYIGMILLLVTTLLILGGLFTAGIAFMQPSIIPGSLLILAFSFLEISFLTALALLFSSFAAPLNASLYTVALFLIGHSLTPVRQYMDTYSGSFGQALMDICYYLLPNLEKFDVRQAVLYGLSISPAQVSTALIYWIFYTALVLVLTNLVIKKQEV
jgi:ABC-type transport system involved in multi-copper enzyme maturation permease subunit